MSRSQLSKLTVVIPTFNRESFVRRQISWWRSSEVRVLILDASPVSIQRQDHLAGTENIRYFHLPGMSYPSRINLARDLVDTPFVALLADDDMFMKSGLENLITEIEMNDTVESAVGRTVRFHISSGEVRGALRYTFDGSFPSFSQGSDLRSYIAENVNRQYSYYAVYQIGCWRKVTAVAFGQEFSSPYVSEVVFQVANSLRMNGKVCDFLWWLRSDEAPAVSTPDWNRSVSFEEWFSEERFTSERQWLITSLSNLGADYGRWTVQEGEAIVEEVLRTHAQNTRPRSISSSRVQSKLICQIKRMIPESLHGRLKSFLPIRMIYSTGIGFESKRLKEHLQSKNIGFSESEFSEFVALVLGTSQTSQRG